MPNTQLAVDWLVSWYGPAGPYTVVADREADGAQGRWRVRQCYPHQLQDLAAFIDANQGRNNLYFVANRPRADLLSSPTEEEMDAYLAIIADVDLPTRPLPDANADLTAYLHLNGQPLPHDQTVYDATLAAINAVNPPPTAVVWSGGGFQAFWRFSAPAPLDLEPQISAQIVALADALGGDHVQNVNRLMRLPGTVNVPNKKKRAEQRVPTDALLLYAHWDRTYAPNATPEPPAAPPPTVDPLASLPKEWAQRIRDGSTSHLKGKDRSRSAAVWAVVCYLLRRDWAPEAILTVLTNPDLGISAHVLDQGNPEAYARRQIADAQAKLESDFARDEKGRILFDDIRNIAQGFRALDTRLMYDVFAEKMSYVNGDASLRHFDDPSINHYRFRFERELHFRPSKDYFYDATQELARANSYHPVLDYLSSLTWDKRPRLETWAIEYGRAEDTPYVRKVSALILLGAVARVRHPGCKFDQMLVFESLQQGTNKSSVVELLAVRPEWYTASLTLGAKDKEMLEQMEGKWLVEFSELQGMGKSEIEAVKSQITRKVDSARLAYGRIRTDRPRTCVLFGTTNSLEYLRDEQNRRFWPLPIQRFDLAALAQVLDQLWAEAAHRHAAGESILLPEEYWPYAAAEQETRRLKDPWEEIFAEAFQDLTGHLPTLQAWDVIGKPGERRTDADQARIGRVMRTLGFEKVHTTALNKRMGYYYARGTPEQRRQPIYVHRDPVSQIVTVTHTPDPSFFDPALLRQKPPTHPENPEDLPF